MCINILYISKYCEKKTVFTTASNKGNISTFKHWSQQRIFPSATYLQWSLEELQYLTIYYMSQIRNINHGLENINKLQLKCFS